MHKVTPFLWFDNNGEEAMNFYVSLFPGSKVRDRSAWGEGGPVPPGGMMVGEFELDGQRVLILNGGPHFKLTEAFSFSVACKDQDEIDYYWNALTADGGEESQCGWLKDKFGLSWQIVPERLQELMSGDDPAGVGRVVQAFMQMKKFDIAALERAYAGE
ncbi:MAG TPA: VOC family protein [Thermomicrobiales bacterium]|jgi:predicted 3-demethylubiquinone-9 3-methyltransferase (glyoxalase superfamily)|nr:VOC family protein [Thermomicrobiales bacterium]